MITLLQTVPLLRMVLIHEYYCVDFLPISNANIKLLLTLPPRVILDELEIVSVPKVEFVHLHIGKLWDTGTPTWVDIGFRMDVYTKRCLESFTVTMAWADGIADMTERMKGISELVRWERPNEFGRIIEFESLVSIFRQDENRYF